MAKQEYGNYLRVPGFEDVLVEVRTIHDDRYMLVYLGLKDDLVNSGICTAQMLESPKRKHERKVDADGESYLVSRYFVSRGGEPIRRYQLTRRKTRASALKLPGAPEAIAKYDAWRRRWERDVEMETARLSALIAPTPQPPRLPRGPDRVQRLGRSGNVVFIDWRAR